MNVYKRIPDASRVALRPLHAALQLLPMSDPDQITLFL